ncbi:hypothetical protein [Pseudoduganella umbonata]|uniref:Uncharacterized protein n=1 Tax=Pseudoduganella umbonata TaxID=864828 RepID=A0A4P8HZZ9_9BURK|nr:hypothetical protein [Pseudoduganella umbonata]MBB3224078.1 hypothetical protein [Pseudoduganella umbonata]QCP14055.1 hypothetical protein FCL38_29295 [Pseudoduganella umbonata]
MHQDPLLASIGGMLRRFKRAEAWLRSAGLPVFLARVPVWLLCLQYCLMMRGKTVRISRVAGRITQWLETITELSQHENARTELLDMDGGMRNDLESTKRTLRLLRELCVDVGGMFDSIGVASRLLDSMQESFLDVVDDASITATTLQRALEMHDMRALVLLREMHEAECQGGLEEANAASVPPEAAPSRDVGKIATNSLGVAAKA